MPTIKDVAKVAGVSISTASYALNGQPNVSEKTRKKVLEVAKELNYYPNASARNLKTKKTGNIGFFIYGFDGPIFGDILEGVNYELRQNGLNIIVSSGESSAVILRERQVDGAIIFDSNIDNDTILKYALGYPVILLDRQLSGSNIHSSQVPNRKLVKNFINEIINKGYNKIGYLSGPIDSPSNNERYLGFKEALDENKIENYKHYQGDFTTNKGYEIGLEIASSNDKPEFIYCANDETAIGLLKAFNEKNINVPNEVAIAGFDGILLGDYVSPKLTTIEIDYKKWGHELAKYISAIINNTKKEELLCPEAIVRFKESTK